LISRYKGTHSFSDDDSSRRLFFGRSSESTALTNKIVVRRLIVLFARSGVGKTSLLNAGVAEKLRSLNHVPLVLRLNDTNSATLPLYAQIRRACERQNIEVENGNETDLLTYFRTVRLWRHDVLLTPVLIFDQFEELFTLQPESNREDFINQLSSLFRGSAAAAGLSRPGDDIEDEPPPDVRVVISMREDFLAELELLASRIPEILDERFRLVPMSRETAREAIEGPARIDDERFEVRPFLVETNATEMILDFLEQRALSPVHRWGNVEPFQLQLVCLHLEQVAREKQGRDGVAVLAESNIGNKSELNKLFRNFYIDRINNLLWRQRYWAKKLCGQYLINPYGRRVRREETEIISNTRIKLESLRDLTEQRLLRAERLESGTYYEISHDSLVIPILEEQRAELLVTATLRGVLFCLTALLVILPAYIFLFKPLPPLPQGLPEPPWYFHGIPWAISLLLALFVAWQVNEMTNLIKRSVFVWRRTRS
jgi:hypothetical protein